MSYRNTASFGKRQEYFVVAELLKRNYDVYMTLVDDQGIDCIIRLDDKRYLDIQIKARSIDAKQWYFFAGLDYKPRDNFFFIFYTERNNSIWVIPSVELEQLCSINKSGKNVGKMHLNLPKNDKDRKSEKFDRYKNENGFNLLKNFMK